MLYYIMFNEQLSGKEAVIIFLLSILAYFISLTLHEFAHGFVAYKMGDLTPKISGRLTVNPFKHLDMLGFISFLLVGIGWAKPVPINPLNFKKYKKGMRWVAIAGILTNVILGLISAGIMAILLATLTSTNDFVGYVLNFLNLMMLVNSFLALFNILPIYPFDGFNFLATFFTGESKFLKYLFKNGAKILLIVLIVCLGTEIFFNFDILDWYLSILYNYVFWPIAMLGV